MLWLCLHLPDFALEIFARGMSVTGPLAVVHGQGRRQRVVLCNAAARRCGVRPGMGTGAALALAGSLRICGRDVESERAALDRLAGWAGRFTPVVSRMPPQALLLEIAGSCRLFGGVDRLQDMVRRGVADLGYQVSMAAAPTPLAASWLVHAGQDVCVIQQSALAAALSPLPLACLGLAAERQEVLHGMGIRTVGDCLRLPRDGLARRMGPQLVYVLDQALGRIPDPRPVFVAPAAFTGSLPLPAPASTAEGLLFAVRRLLLELEGFLRARDQGARSLVLSLRHASGAATRLGLGLVVPSRDAAHLAMLMRERLERVALPAPVEEVLLHVARPCPLAPRSQDFFAPTHVAEDGVLIERLRARLGRAAVHGLGLVAEHRPERAWACAEPGEQGAAAGTESGRQARGSAHASWEAVARKRPLWLLRDPVRLEVHGGHPYLDGTLVIAGNRERIESGWWDGQDIARDYFVVRTRQGARLWVYRELDGGRCWFLHGIFG